MFSRDSDSDLPYSNEGLWTDYLRTDHLSRGWGSGAPRGGARVSRVGGRGVLGRGVGRGGAEGRGWGVGGGGSGRRGGGVGAVEGGSGRRGVGPRGLPHEFC